MDFFRDGPDEPCKSPALIKSPGPIGPNFFVLLWGEGKASTDLLEAGVLLL